MTHLLKACLVLLFLGTPETAHSVSRSDNLDSLRGVEASLQKNLSAVQARISELEVQLRIQEVRSLGGGPIKTTASLGGSLRAEPSIFGEAIGSVGKGATLVVLGYQSGYFRVSDGTSEGYYTKSKLEMNESMTEMERLFDELGLGEEIEAGKLASQIALSDSLERYWSGCKQDPAWVSSDRARVRKAASTESGSLGLLSKGHPLLVSESSPSWSKVHFLPGYYRSLDTLAAKTLTDSCLTGWIHNSLISNSPVVRLGRRDLFLLENPDTPLKFRSLIRDGKITFGMTREMVIASWGQPDDVNRTVTQLRTHEQWVYNDEYVYFDDGVVTSWQD